SLEWAKARRSERSLPGSTHWGPSPHCLSLRRRRLAFNHLLGSSSENVRMGRPRARDRGPESHPLSCRPGDLGLLPAREPEMMEGCGSGSWNRPANPAARRPIENLGTIMTALVVLSCLALVPDGPQAPAAPAPAEVVASLEAVLADAIAQAEPSVVAIHRQKGENPQETQAVRGRKRPGRVPDPSPFGSRFGVPMEPTDFISLDYGSGVVIGT